jgi:hypothetical protein
MSKDHTSRKDQPSRNRFRDTAILQDQLTLFRNLPFLGDQLALFRSFTVEEQKTFLRTLNAKVSHGLLKNLSSREIALMYEGGRADKQAARAESERAAWEQAILGEDCPPLQARLFWSLADGCLFKQRGVAPGRTKLQCGTVTVWAANTLPLPENEVLALVYTIEWRNLNEQKRLRLKARLRTLQRVLNNRLLKRKLPFRVTRPPGGGQLWLQVLTNDTVEKKDRSRYERRLSAAKPPTKAQSSVEECLDFVRKALAKRPQKATDLKEAWEKRGGRPGTLRRVLKQLGVKHAKEGFGASSEWYVSLPIQGEQRS